MESEDHGVNLDRSEVEIVVDLLQLTCHFIEVIRHILQLSSLKQSKNIKDLKLRMVEIVKAC